LAELSAPHMVASGNHTFRKKISTLRSKERSRQAMAQMLSFTWE
jgi:hypothetical protein